MTAFPRQVAVIVDPLRAGTKLPQLFTGLGHRCVGVLSQQSDSPFWRESFRPQDLLTTLEERDGFDRLVRELARWEISCIVPGGESGVNLTDRLTEAFPEVPGLDPATSAARRDKYHMAQALTAAGLSAIPHCRTRDVNAALAWYRTATDGNAVVKPLASTSAEGVHFCATPDELAAAFAAVRGSISLFNQLNDEVLVQQDISRDGATEYTVNSVSSRGLHHVTDVWRMRRQMVGATAVCVYSDLVGRDEDEFAALADYCADVLSALGVRNGTAHSEIMLTATGPILIETGARVEGACDPAIALSLCGYSQNSLLPMSYLDPVGFAHAVRRPQPRPRVHARHVYLLSPVEGHVARSPDLSAIRALPTFGGLETSLDAVPV
ncbi:MAG TPA: ATP-grasp domain-containing protein, partial [Kineosporiaceae bacterium]